jgi:hypothetical protein
LPNIHDINYRILASKYGENFVENSISVLGLRNINIPVAIVCSKILSWKNSEENLDEILSPACNVSFKII